MQAEPIGVSPFFSETTTDSLLSPHHTFMTDLQLPMQYYNDFEYSVSNEESDSVSSTTNLLKSSKKIQKSPQDQSASPKESRRRPNRKRNDWRPEEDARLLELMKEFGQSWAMISSKLPGRTGKQIRDRYVNNLAPGIKCGGWTPQEDQMILSLRNMNGNRWSYIASQLPGRTEAQVKNRFYSYINKKPMNDFSKYQNRENFSSPVTSQELEVDFEEDLFEVGTAAYDYGILVESSGFDIEDSEEKDVACHTVNCVATNVGSIIDDDRMSYGNIIRIPCFTGRPESLQEPLENPLLTGSFRSSKKSCAVQKLVEDMSMTVIENDGQLDKLLNHAVDCAMEGRTDPYDVEKFFSEDLSEKEKEFQKSNQRKMELRSNKNQLEKMLAAVMKEIEDLTRSDL
jgi:hypothetical protein